MEIDSTHLALVVQGTIKRAKEGDPLAKETLEQWNRANQEDGLPPMEQLLRDWVEKNQPKESEAPKQGELTPEEERELVVDGMMIGMDFITEDGAVKYADFFAQMVNTFGDGIRPYVAQIYLGLSAKVDDDTADQMDDRATVRKFNVNTIVLPPVVMQNLEKFAKLTANLVKLAYRLVQLGVWKLDDYYNIANQAIGKQVRETLKAPDEWVAEWIKSIWEENYTNPESGETKTISEWAKEAEEADAAQTTIESVSKTEPPIDPPMKEQLETSLQQQVKSQATTNPKEALKTLLVLQALRRME